MTKDPKLPNYDTRLVNVESRVNCLVSELEGTLDGVADRLESLETWRRNMQKSVENLYSQVSAAEAVRKPPVHRPYEIKDPKVHEAAYNALAVFQQSVDDHDGFIDNQAVQTFLRVMAEQGYRILHKDGLIDLADYYTASRSATRRNNTLERRESRPWTEEDDG